MTQLTGHSKEEFGSLLKTEGKYVLLYAYTGEVTPQAEAYVSALN
jgi:hypothetical protein